MPPSFSEDDVHRMQATLVELCEARGDRIALLDPTAAMAQDAARGFPLLQEWRSRFDSRQAALYYPWLQVPDPLAISPHAAGAIDGHVAGLYAQLDNEIGVHRAPANRVLAWAEDVSAAVDDARHGELNTMGIQRASRPAGLGSAAAWCAHLSSDPLWRFVNVRRLVMMVMKAINLSTQWAVFEPNDHDTRTRIALALTEFSRRYGVAARWWAPAPSNPSSFAATRATIHPRRASMGNCSPKSPLRRRQPFEFVVLRIGKTRQLVRNHRRPAGGRGRECMSIDERLDPVMAFNFRVSLLDATSSLAAVGTWPCPRF